MSLLRQLGWQFIFMITVVPALGQTTVPTVTDTTTAPSVPRPASEVLYPDQPPMRSVAQQPDKALLGKDIYFEPAGGIRSRYFHLWKGTGGAFTENEKTGYIRSRAQIDFKLHKGEFFEFFTRMLHAGTWGQQSSANNGGYLDNPAVRDDYTANNGFYMNQAYGVWNVADSLGFKFGRSPIHIGRGLMYGSNDWFDVPNTFDHFDIMFDWASVELNIIGAKVQELQTVTGQTIAPDPEENHYIAEVNITDLADWIKMFNVTFAQINRDNGSADGGTTVLPALNAQRLGFDFVFQSRSFVGELYAGIVNGKQRAAQEGTIGQSVVDFKLTFNRLEWSNMNIFALYHVDTGDNDLTDTTDKHYGNHFYDVYGRSGRMDFLRWGNLTMFSLGFNIEALTDMRLGMEFWSFKKTKDADTPEFGQGGSFVSSQIAANNITLAPESDLGDEFDLWIERRWPSGVNVGITLSAFKPGGVFKNATTTSGSQMSENVFQVISEVKYFF